MKDLYTVPDAVVSENVSFPYRGGIHCFQPDQIIRLQADNNYTCIFFSNHKPILMAKVLCGYQRLLEPFGFIRTHRSHLINKQHISAVLFNGDIIMDDKSKAEISRRKRKEVFYALKNEYWSAKIVGSFHHPG